ncbi:hypothetical protein ThidrDRAFT_2670 [Thiorhodococcus drewsii AZ1]|uniref:Uncharacterized protein n=2 Tax=Thiorhodococcus drewsii TaxID=210408 RepID=G2E307_9GAMM|nr:hypothetical protein ThidrDRAFT_2670 [Thiorhodococcus drewsii AZ1]
MSIGQRIQVERATPVLSVLLLGVAAASAPLLVDSSSVFTWALACVLFVAAVFVACRLGRRMTALAAASRAEIQGESDERSDQLEVRNQTFERLGVELFPIFVRHIEHFRTLAEHGVTHLSGIFSQLSAIQIGPRHLSNLQFQGPMSQVLGSVREGLEDLSGGLLACSKHDFMQRKRDILEIDSLQTKMVDSYSTVE